MIYPFKFFWPQFSCSYPFDFFTKSPVGCCWFKSHLQFLRNSNGYIYNGEWLQFLRNCYERIGWHRLQFLKNCNGHIHRCRWQFLKNCNHEWSWLLWLQFLENSNKLMPILCIMCEKREVSFPDHRKMMQIHLNSQDSPLIRPFPKNCKKSKKQ